MTSFTDGLLWGICLASAPLYLLGLYHGYQRWGKRIYSVLIGEEKMSSNDFVGYGLGFLVFSIGISFLTFTILGCIAFFFGDEK